MKKVLFASLFSVIFFTLGQGQDFDITLKKRNKEKTLKIKERNRVNITMMSEDESLGQIYHQLEVKICGVDGDSLSVCVINDRRCVSSGEPCVARSSTRYLKGNYDQRKVAFADLKSIQKSSYTDLSTLNAFAGLISGAFIVIVNPMLSYDFDAKERDPKLWLRAHLISLAVIVESTVFISRVKPKVYQLSNLPGAWRIVD